MHPSGVQFGGLSVGFMSTFRKARGNRMVLTDANSHSAATREPGLNVEALWPLSDALAPASPKGRGVRLGGSRAFLHAPQHNAKDDTGNADRPGDDEEDAVSAHQRVAVLRQIVDQGA